MAFDNLRRNFAAPAAALGMSVAAATSPLSGALAEDEPQQRYAAAATSESAPTVLASTSSSASTISIEPYATSRAIRWAKETDGVAVNVSLGIGSRITPEQIVSVLSEEFKDAGEPNVAFFFERNDRKNTLLSYHYGVTGGGGAGPFTLNESKEPIQDVVDQNHFYEENPELGV